MDVFYFRIIPIEYSKVFGINKILECVFHFTVCHTFHYLAIHPYIAHFLLTYFFTISKCN